MYLNNSAVLEELDFLPGFTIPVIILLAVEIILGIASTVFMPLGCEVSIEPGCI